MSYELVLPDDTTRAAEVVEFMDRADAELLDTVVEVCREPGAEVERFEIEDVVNEIVEQPDGTKVRVPMVRLRYPDQENPDRFNFFDVTVDELITWRSNLASSSETETNHEQASNVMTPQERRRTELFKPPKTEKTDRPQTDNYNYLFGTDEEYEQGLKQRLEQKEEFDNEAIFPVTEAQEAQAQTVVGQMMQNPTFRDKIEPFLAGGEMSSKELVELIRTSNPLRQELGRYFIWKAELYPDAMPYRVNANTIKAPSEPGYDAYKGMSSKEYVARLCLSMLDGTYDHTAESADQIEEFNHVTQQGVGQHRYAARQLLAI